MDTTIAIANQKGGVAKTTTTLNLGYELALRGRKVVLVDADPQASLTISLGFEEQAVENSLAEVMGGHQPGKKRLKDVIQRIPVDADKLFLVPSDLALAGSEMGLFQRIKREDVLKMALSSLQSDGTDYVLVDCPPSLGLLTINALAAADFVLVPLQLEYLSIRAFKLSWDTFLVVRESINAGLQLLGILPTFYRQRTKHHRQVQADLQQLASFTWIMEPIPNSIVVADAHADLSER